MKIQGVRSEVLNNVPEIYKLLKKKDELITELRAMQESINNLAEDGEKIGQKVQKIKDKSIPKIEMITSDIELKQNLTYNCPNCKWETITSVQIEGDEVTATITDAIDTYKQSILTKVEENKQKENEDKSSDTDKG